jgi:diguanylate cyclase (GGDEF)-like protein/PAS domain S-box-containing protein
MDRFKPISGPAIDGIVYFLLAAATISTTRFGGGVAFIWIATAFLFSRLKLSAPTKWPATLLACGIGSALATVLVGTGPITALPLALLNMSEALIGAVLLRRIAPKARPLETLHGTLAFFFCLGIVAPAVTAPFSAAAISAVTASDLFTNMLRWYAGHALGAVAFAPLFILAMRGELRSWSRSLSAARIVETTIIFMAVAATTAVVFSQNRFPLLFLILLPLMAAVFRLQAVGAASSIILVIVIGGVYTINGSGPASTVGVGVGDHLQFLQFYLAALVMITLPVVADLAQRDRLLNMLRDSEARFRLLAEHSTDVIISIAPDGIVRFVSKAITRLGGYCPEDVIGNKASDFVIEDDVPAVLEAYRSAFQSPDTLSRVEYRCRTADGSPVWVEAHVQGLVNDQGELEGLVTVLRGTEERRKREQQLVRQAVTDPLTGISNRRGFFKEVDAWLISPQGSPGCFVLLDLDHFKRINDEHGHQVGDDVLVEFAQLLRSVLRENDVIGRVGGEEFCALLRGSSQEQAAAACERLRMICAKRPLHTRTGRLVRVTASAGIVVLRPGMNRQDIYRLADMALYQAKSTGRDRAAIAA